MAANLTQLQLSRIVSATDCQASMTSKGIPKLTISDSSLAKVQQQSLGNLIEFVTSQPEWLPDDRVFRVWQDHAEEHQEETADAIRHRSESEDAVTPEEWRERYALLGLF